MSSIQPILVTGGAGFIGSHFVRDWLADASACPVINLDALTYAGNLQSLRDVAKDVRYQFIHGDIGNRSLVDGLLAKYQPRAIVHFAAETHVDRSIDAPEVFIRANVDGTGTLLEATRDYWSSLQGTAKERFRFLHISTDEVYGALKPEDAPFTETSPYRPNSPYAASKAASDHLVRAWHHTYGLPVLITHCSNNYGPNQFPEKLIPLMIAHALTGKKLPIYGDGHQRRDWLYVGDHCAALREVLAHGYVGETYAIGGWNERTNRDIVELICATLDNLTPAAARGLPINHYHELIAFVTDRPGHDRRYAIDASKIERDLHWRPHTDFTIGMENTIRWYLDNPAWVEDIQTGAYRTEQQV